jgi:hypothetical protein
MRMHLLGRTSLIAYATLWMLPGCSTSGPTGRGSDHAVVAIRLDSALRVLPRTFTRIEGFVEIRPGLVAVADPVEMVVVLFDLTKGRQRVIGGIGGGPGEYRRPWRLFRFAGDSILLYDIGNRRLVLYDSTGTPGRELNVPMALIGEIVGADTLGRIYFRQSPARFAEHGATSDSSVLVRWHAATSVDTLFRLREAPSARSAQSSGNQATTFLARNPFGLEDDCAVLPSGDVVVARADPYHREIWSSSYRRLRGPNLPVDSVPVTRSDRRPYERSDLNFRFDWPAHKPPFSRGAIVSTPAADETWVRRSTRQGAASATYDVLSSDGSVRVRVNLAGERSRVLAVGQGGVYVASIDSMDLWRIHVHPRPHLLGRVSTHDEAHAVYIDRAHGSNP